MPPDASDAAITPSGPEAAAGEPPGTGKHPPKPLRPRHEAFCQYFVLGASATYAARAAGYAPPSCKNQGYRLMRQPRIIARIADIRRGLARDYALDAQVLLGKLEALYQCAVEDHHFHAGVRAVEAQARIAGHLQVRAALAALPALAAAKTTNDDFPASVAAANEAKTTGYGEKAGGNDDFRTTQ